MAPFHDLKSGNLNELQNRNVSTIKDIARLTGSDHCALAGLNLGDKIVLRFEKDTTIDSTTPPSYIRYCEIKIPCL